MVLEADNRRVGRWYFGGLAGCCAACFTHPLDLLKVHLQTQQAGKLTLPGMTAKIYRSDGLLGFYSGLSASLLRQMTYTTARFAVYETVKKQLTKDNNKTLSFVEKISLAAFSGACGGIVGSPADLINVRMQNDIKLPKEQRRHYKNALDGVVRIARDEGVKELFNGGTMAVARAVLMTIGQLSFYDQIKQTVLEHGYADDIYAHLFSSCAAASMATVLTQPVDVLKTRMMNAKPGEYKGIAHCAMITAKSGPLAFFKGFVPAFVRLAPHSVLLFVFFEQIRQRFGDLPPSTSAVGGGGGGGGDALKTRPQHDLKEPSGVRK